MPLIEAVNSSSTKNRKNMNLEKVPKANQRLDMFPEPTQLIASSNSELLAKSRSSELFHILSSLMMV